MNLIRRIRPSGEQMTMMAGAMAVFVVPVNAIVWPLFAQAGVDLSVALPIALASGGLGLASPFVREAAVRRKNREEFMFPDDPAVVRMNEITSVRLTGDFCAWEENRIWLDKSGGSWRISLDLPIGETYHYKFLIQGQGQGGEMGDDMPDREIGVKSINIDIHGDVSVLKVL